jgi:hypothetical protein
MIELKIKLRTAMLGAKRTQNNTRVFERDTSYSPSKLKIDLPQWYWAIKEAQDSLGMQGVDPFGVRLEAAFDAPKLEMYVRRWADKRQADNREMFESVRKGAILTFPMILLTKTEPGAGAAEGKRPPSMSELYDTFECVGMMLGLSPWGSKFGYGRFSIHSLEKYDSTKTSNTLTVGRGSPDNNTEHPVAGEVAEVQGTDDRGQ